MSGELASVWPGQILTTAYTLAIKPELICLRLNLSCFKLPARVLHFLCLPLSCHLIFFKSSYTKILKRRMNGLQHSRVKMKSCMSWQNTFSIWQIWSRYAVSSNLSIYLSILAYCTTATKSAPLGFRGWLGWGQTTWRSWGRWHSKQTTTTRRMMKNRIRVMSRRRMKSLQTMDKLESPRKNNKTWLCEGLQPSNIVGWFYMLRMIVAVSYCAHAGFILKVLGFAWCKTCITLNLQFYSLGESRFLNGDFFFQLLHFGSIGTLNFFWFACSI